MQNERQQQYLGAMGIQLWERRDRPELLEESAESVVVPDVRVEPPIIGSDAGALDWNALEQHIAACTDCGLHETRSQTVFGTGHHNADWMIIGEAPGVDEDRQGEPFVGRAGQLLNAMLSAIGLKREQVFIANIVKCRPPNNRNPLPEEANACEAYLLRQIELVKPKIILAVGKVAAGNLLKTDSTVGSMRGCAHSFGVQGIPLVVTYHPAYLLRSPKEKRKAWQDLQLACKVLGKQD